MKKDIRTKDRLRRCVKCNRNFYWVRKWQKFCSSNCRWENWEKNNPRVKLADMKKIIPLIIGLLLIASSAFAMDIDFDTIAMIESSNNPLAYNQSSGARGIFQITKICLEDYNDWHSRGQYTLADLFDPAISKHISIWYLTERIPQMLRHNKEEVNITNVLICYNFGIGNFLKWDGDIETLPLETRNYLDRYNWYKGGAK